MSEFKLEYSMIFRGVDEEYIAGFLSSCEMITVTQGEFLFHQNQVGDHMYIVASGKMQVLINNKEVGIISSGSLLGELCVFGQPKRSASILVLEDSTLLKINGEDFRTRIYSKELDALLICYNITRELSKRLIETDSLL